MTSSKKRSRARRRVEHRMEEAFAAVADGELALADKLSRRAVEGGFVNPRIWLDRGRVARLCRDDDAAEAAFRHAIAIAPTYADAFVELGRLQAEHGKSKAAVRLLARAVELRPDDAAVAADRDRLLDLVGPERGDPTPAVEEAEAPAPTVLSGGYGWDEVEAGLLARGVAKLSGFASPAVRADVVASAGDPARVETVFEHDDASARARIRFLREPVPEAVAAIRAELYARLAVLASRLQERLGRPVRYPPALADLAARCAAAGQVRAGVALLEFAGDGFMTPVAEPPPKVTFPFRATVSLGSGPGLRHLLRDLRPGRRPRVRETALGPGDALIACDRQRVVQIAGVDGLQDVAHGWAPGEGGPALLLHLPFVGVG